MEKSTKAPAKRASYLKKMSVAVRGHFSGATTLPVFLSTLGELTIEERKLIVRQALLLIEQNYAHLPLKRAMHSIDPAQRLKLLLQTLELGNETVQPSEIEFHGELTDIFTSLRDLHTNYLLPNPFSGMTAFLPFMVEDYFEGDQRRYIVSHVIQGFGHETFVPGVEVTYWNGMPIERAVWQNAKRYAGSNREARHARGVQTLTVRALRISAPPDEEWVVVGYRTLAGKNEELRIDWQVNPPLPSSMDGDGSVTHAAVLGFDLEQDIIQRVRLSLFAPQVVAAEKKAAVRMASAKSASNGVGSAKASSNGAATLQSELPNVFQAREVETSAGTFGYLRIYTFNHWPPREFVTEFIRLITALPKHGLIIDVRGNGGGVIMNGELILQTLTPRRIEPEPLQFVNTPLNLQICSSNGKTSPWTDLTPWVESMKQALQTGATFSAGFPITEPEECNAIGQKYFGPVVLITDALCYSTTDIFAAGFQDHEIGPVLGVDGNTGAGGANVWEHRYFPSHILPGSVYQSLPKGAGMRVSIRRTLRVGRRAGTPVEDLGVVPNHRHFLTRNDLLDRNVDLINQAGALLAEASGRARELAVTFEPASATEASVTVLTTGMTRIDAYIGDRPVVSVDLVGGTATFRVPSNGGAGSSLEIRGYDMAELVARYRTEI